MIISWGWFWGHFEWILKVFWEDFWIILGSCSVQKSSWKRSESWVEAGSRFSEFDADHFGRFWTGFGNHFGDILVSFVDIDFTMKFHMILKQFLMDFDTLSTSKIKQKAWRVLQKSTLHVICYRTSMDIDLRRISSSGWEQFWVPIGLQKRLRKQVL